MQQEFRRDNDILLLSSIRGEMDEQPGTNFILTGSYAIEALTRTPVAHNDIDGNVFSADLVRARSRLLNLGYHIVTDRNNRVEFDVPHPEADLPVRRVEIGLVKTINALGDNSSVFYLENASGDPFIVPTELAPLVSSKGDEYLFRVKSLSYAIATWMIRISGIVSNQKRDVRPSDISHLALLLERDYKYDDVIMNMKNHPQMPPNIPANTVFEKALTLVHP